MMVYIKASGTDFQNENAAMLWFLNNTTGAADDWAQEHRLKLIDNNMTGEVRDMSALMDAFMHAFGDPDAARAAHRRITALKHTDSIQEYITEFKGYAADLGWNEQALMDQFSQGLHPKVGEALSMREVQPTTLDGLIRACTTIDNVRRENILKYASHKTNKTTTSTSNTTPKATSTTTTTTTRSSSSKPNYVGKEIKDRRRAEGLCIKCGTAGHGFADCKIGWRLEDGKKETKEVKEVKREKGSAATIVEVEDSDSDSESGKD